MELPEFARESERRQGFYLAWLGLTQVALIGATWPLWWTAFADVSPAGEQAWRFPQVPLIAAAGLLPVWVDRLAIVSWLLATLGQLLASIGIALAKNRQGVNWELGWTRYLRTAIGCGLVASLLLVVINQHRLQAWAYLSWWIGLLWLLSQRTKTNALPDPRGILARWRWLAVSVYFYSAISKFDTTFVQSLGNQFATTMWNLFSGNRLPLDTLWPTSLVLLFPLGELLLALGLASGYLRRGFCLLAIAMHALLLLILGPLGLQHQPGVLLWNVFFIGQAYLLFWPLRTEPDGPSSKPTQPRCWANLALYFVLLWPLTQPWGWCDHWPAWELYAPRGSRIQVFLASPAWEVADDLAEFASEEPSDQFGPIWRELRLDRWSLQQLRAPIYPQDRFQLGVAEYVLGRIPEEQQVLIQWHGPADRWSGQRDQRLLRGRREVQEFGSRFHWNARPR